MAFIRAKWVPAKGKLYGPYYEEVEEYRDANGKPRQRVLKYLGRTRPAGASVAPTASAAPEPTAPTMAAPDQPTAPEGPEITEEVNGGKKFQVIKRKDAPPIHAEDGIAPEKLDQFYKDYGDDIKDSGITSVRLYKGEATAAEAPDTGAGKAGATLAFYNTTGKSLTIFRVNEKGSSSMSEKGIIKHELAHAKDETILEKYGLTHGLDSGGNAAENKALDAIREKRGTGEYYRVAERMAAKEAEFKKLAKEEETKAYDQHRKEWDKINNSNLGAKARENRLKKLDQKYSDDKDALAVKYSRNQARWDILGPEVKAADPRLYHIIEFRNKVRDDPENIITSYQGTVMVFQPDRLRAESFAEYARIEHDGSAQAREQLHKAPAYADFKAVYYGQV